MSKASVSWFGQELKPNVRLYRYLPLHRAIQLITSSEFPMMLPAAWWDPLETVWSEQRYQEARRLAKKTVFASCWTTGARNDALWQIYARAAPAVRIRTSVGALVNALSTDVLSAGKLYLGKVKYCAESELIGLAGELMSATQKKDVSRLLVKGLMHKRQAFSFEDELRAVWVKKGGDPRKIVNVPFDVGQMIDQIRIDPRLEGGLAVSIASAMTRLSGISDVKQSTLAVSPV